MRTVIFDHTALAALGSGNPALSRLVKDTNPSTDQYVYVPALCLAAATADRPALADHIGSLPAIHIMELAFSGAAMVGRLVAEGADWRMAHAVHVSRPSVEWPDGMPVVTAITDRYKGHGVATIPIPGLN